MADPGFLELQYQFTAHMRDPAANPAPKDVEDRRLEIYRNLLFNNVEGFMANAFPVLRSLTDDDDWQRMIRDYFSRHQAHTPLFPKMPQEFLHYLNNLRDDDNDPPFMRELSHYEWLEAEVQCDTRELDDIRVDSVSMLLDAVPVLNTVMRPEAYAFDVHRISPDYQPTEPPAEPTYLVVLRHRNDEVGFVELNAVSARLLQLMIENTENTAREILLTIAAELGHPQPNAIVESGQDILQTFIDRDIILGTRAPAG